MRNFAPKLQITMKKRFLFLTGLYALMVAVFALEKMAFLLYVGGGYGLSDHVLVALHGLRLDATVAGYFAALPWLATIVSVWAGLRLRRWATPYYALISIAMSLAFVADAALYPFWGFKLDSTVLNYIDKPSDALASVSAGFVLAAVLCIAAMSVGLVFLLRRLTPVRLPSLKSGSKGRILATILLLALGGPLFIAIRGGVSESTANVGSVYFSNDEQLNHAAVNPLFSFLSTALKDRDYGRMFQTYDEAGLAKRMEGLYFTEGETADTLLNTTRPNLLIVVMEGFGYNMFEAEGVAPRLNQLAKEGVWFGQCYAGSFRTDRGLVCTLSGHPGLPTVSIMKDASKCDAMPSVARTLQRQGYSTTFVYGGDINFTNTKGYLLATGFERIVADVDFPANERSSGAWGANDGFTAKRVLEEIRSEKDGHPWMYTYLTLSSHEPFDVPYHRIKDNEVTNSFAYTDHCIGQLIDGLKQTEAWKNTLVVLLPDHSVRAGGIGHATSSDPDFFHIPMIWVGGAVKKPVCIGKIVSQSDLAATLLGQMGLPHGDFVYSRDVLSRAYAYPFAYSSYNNGIVFRDSTGATVFDNETQRPLTDTPTPSPLRLERAKAILQSSYIDLDKR